MMLADSAQSKLWRTSALNFNVRLFRLPSVLAAFLATPGGSESRSTHRGPKERPESASNEPTAAKTEQKVEPWTMSSNVNFHRTVENLASQKKCLIDTGFAPPQGRVWPQSGNQVKSTSVFSHVLTACDISRVFLAWLGTSICTSAHFFPRSSSVLRRSV